MVNKSEVPGRQYSDSVSDAIADSPTTEDLLGFKTFTVPIAARIAAATSENTPMTIGIYGEWGSGKTSFLMMVDEALREKGINPIWFNAWKYDQEDNLWSALLQTILDQARISGKWYRRVWVKLRIWWDSIDLRAGGWEVLRKLTPVIVRASVFLVCAGLFLGWSTQEIEDFLSQVTSRLFQGSPIIPALVVKALVVVVGIVATKPDALLGLLDAKLGIDFSKLSRKRTYREHIAFLDEFSKEFERIIRLVGKGKPLVVIIDDLDRCLPEKAVSS